MKVPDWFIWVGMTLAAMGFVLVIAASSGHALTGEIEVNWIANETCIISGEGIGNAVVEEDCDEDFRFNVERVAVNHSVVELFDCNYSEVLGLFQNFSEDNYTLNFTCEQNQSIAQINSAKTELLDFMQDEFLPKLDDLGDLQETNTNLSNEVTIWKSNASGSWASINSLERENTNLSRDREIWQYASFVLFAVVVLLSPLGASARQKIFGVK